MAAQLTGIPNTSGVDEFAQWGEECVAYTFPNVHADAHVVAPFLDEASPLRTTHLRDPEGPATTFATESFMDELAAAAKADPIEFRLKYLDDERLEAALKKAAEKFGWIAGLRQNTRALQELRRVVAWPWPCAEELAWPLWPKWK